MSEEHTTISDVKALLTGTIDEKLEVIERRTKERLQIKMKIVPIPSEYEYIVNDVVLKRFNRIGNEGMESYSQEGLSMTFNDSDFDEYIDEINDYIEANDPKMQRKSIARFR